MFHAETGGELAPQIASGRMATARVGGRENGPPLPGRKSLSVSRKEAPIAQSPRALPAPRLPAESLRRYAWEIGERRAHSAYTCPDSYVNLTVVAPGQAFIVWRVQPAWVDGAARRKAGQWDGARLIVRLYDVSGIAFNGFNARQMRDIPIETLHGDRLLAAPLAGTTQLAELGFLLRNREFVPAARSMSTLFPSGTVSQRADYAALYVDDRLAPEPVASPWEAEAYVRERRKPKLRSQLRIAMLSFEAEAAGHQGPLATFVSSLGAELCAQGQQIHAFVPARDGVQADFERAGVTYHPLAIAESATPVEKALGFARALEGQLAVLPSFNLFHMQEWMTALVPWLGTRPAVLALSSLETTRRNGAPVNELSQHIERLEREAARAVECLVVPAWLSESAPTLLGVDRSRLHIVPMEGRPLDEWEVPLDAGRIKAEIGLHAFDRMLLFVGPLEGGAGPDLLVEALPTVVSRAPNARVVFVGCGGMHNHLLGRAHQLGFGHAVRLLGHVEMARLVPLLRASEALLLPSRHRVARDEDVLGLARRAGRPVLTTHGGPAHLVRHEQDGLVAYDNPPSLVWGMSRLLDDPRHSEEMGRNGVQHGAGASWSGLARRYADLCAESFPELTEAGTRGDQ